MSSVSRSSSRSKAEFGFAYLSCLSYALHYTTHQDYKTRLTFTTPLRISIPADQHSKFPEYNGQFERCRVGACDAHASSCSPRDSRISGSSAGNTHTHLLAHILPWTHTHAHPITNNYTSFPRPQTRAHSFTHPHKRTTSRRQARTHAHTFTHTHAWPFAAGSSTQDG